MVSYHPNEKCMLRRLAVAVEPVRITSLPIRVCDYKHVSPARSVYTQLITFKRECIAVCVQ